MTGTPTDAIDIDFLRTWIGRENIISDVITVDLARKFNATLDIRAEQPVEGDVASPLIHFCLGQPAELTSQLGQDGHPKKGGFLPPVPLPRRMWAGGKFFFISDLRVGDTVRRVSRIADVSVKEGRSGVLCFVAVEHVLDVSGKIAIREQQDIVYREAATGGVIARAFAGEKPVVAGHHQMTVMPDAPLLFRYSALTFNGHRIHYDRTYAREAECYPGLVVHGPMQATWLLHYARKLKGRMPTEFSFRGQSPLFDDDRIHIHAREENGKMVLWTMREGGPVAMSAEAIWA